MLSLKENTESENVCYYCLSAALKHTTSLTQSTCCRVYFIALKKHRRMGSVWYICCLWHPSLCTGTEMFLNCDLQVWYLSLNMIETQGANYCSAELQCENSDIWNCSPSLNMHHKSIDLISYDLWYRMAVKELKQQCCYSVSCTRTWLRSLLCDEKGCKLQLGLAALCLPCCQRASLGVSVPLNSPRSMADKNKRLPVHLAPPGFTVVFLW